MRFLSVQIALILSFVISSSAWGQNTACLPANGTPLILYTFNPQFSCQLEVSGDALLSVPSDGNCCNAGCIAIAPFRPQQNPLDTILIVRQTKLAQTIEVSSPGTYNYTFNYLSACSGGGCCNNSCPINYSDTWTILPALAPVISGNLNICNG